MVQPFNGRARVMATFGAEREIENKRTIFPLHLIRECPRSDARMMVLLVMLPGPRDPVIIGQQTVFVFCSILYVWSLIWKTTTPARPRGRMDGEWSSTLAAGKQQKLRCMMDATIHWSSYTYFKLIFIHPLACTPQDDSSIDRSTRC